jgi:hypothetical protein
MIISGKVLDSEKEPLHLANITIVTGSQTNKFGTTANENGDFELESDIIDDDSQFKISYLGFRPQYYKASELQGRVIKMEEDAIELNSVVISPKSKPTNKKLSKPSNIKQYLQEHKTVYAGLGGVIGLALILISIKKLK